MVTLHLKVYQNSLKIIKLNFQNNYLQFHQEFFGYMGYEMIKFFENVKLEKKNSLNLPDSIFLRPSITLVFDNVNDKIIISKLVTKDNKRNSTQQFKKS